MSDADMIQQTPAQKRYAAAMTDILVYTVVLNLFVEHHKAIEIDSFTISIFTAIVLTLLLDVILRFEHLVSGYFKGKDSTAFRIIGLLVTFAILFLSKFLILEVVDLVFGDEVELGHLVDVIVLIITMIVARQLVTYVYDRLGPPPAVPAQEG
jgi:hypothetical protein